MCTHMACVPSSTTFSRSPANPRCSFLLRAIQAATAIHAGKERIDPFTSLESTSLTALRLSLPPQQTHSRHTQKHHQTCSTNNIRSTRPKASARLLPTQSGAACTDPENWRTRNEHADCSFTRQSSCGHILLWAATGWRGLSHRKAPSLCSPLLCQSDGRA